MTAATGRVLLVTVLFVLAVAPPIATADALRVAWEPARPRAGDVVLARLTGVPADAIVDAVVDGHPLNVFPAPGGYAALHGIDMDVPDGPIAWRVFITARGHPPRTAEGRLTVRSRAYTVQHLTVAKAMAELDPDTERRAVDESERLRTVYRTISGERLWQGRFVRPVAGAEPGTGFGARRVINGLPRQPHSGTDYPAPVGAPVVAANRGRVALVGEFYFPGRLVIVDHGLGLHTAYFHLDAVAVSEGQLVARGERLGTVGMTGRVTGAHLHFGAQVGSARIDPATLLQLAD